MTLYSLRCSFLLLCSYLTDRKEPFQQGISNLRRHRLLRVVLVVWLLAGVPTLRSLALVCAFVCAFVSAFACSFRACVLSWVEIYRVIANPSGTVSWVVSQVAKFGMMPFLRRSL
jgi:hypothetical protein